MSRTVRQSPQRSCVGCGARAAQSTLVRLQLGVDGELVPVDRPAGGRSAYVHDEARCLDAMTKKRSLRRALRRDVTPEVCARAAERVRTTIADAIER